MATTSFNEFIVGPNTIDIQKFYPSSRQRLLVNLGTDITGYTIAADYQVLVVDTIAFDRHSGDPNFAESTLIGTFPLTEITGGDVPTITDATAGDVEVVIPADMYTGPMYPGDRTNALVAVVGFTYTDLDGFIETIRIPRLISYEPDVAIGNPVDEVDYEAKV